MSHPDAVSVNELNQTFGVLLLGLIFAVTLYGLTFFQTYIYYSRFPEDCILSKCAVGVIWAVDTATTALLSQILYHYMISGFMIPFIQLDITKTFIAESGIASFGIFAVQTFYAVRIWSVNDRNPMIPGLVFFLALAGLAMGLVGTAVISRQPLLYNFVSREVEIVSSVQYAICTVCDLVILISPSSSWRSSRTLGEKAPKNVYEYVVVYFLNRGTCFTLLQIACLITFVTMPSHQVWIFFQSVTSKTYVNSLMAMLNFRDMNGGRGSIATDAHSIQFRTKTNDTLTGRGGGTSRGMHLNVVEAARKPSALMTVGLGQVHSVNEEDDDESSKQNVSVANSQ